MKKLNRIVLLLLNKSARLLGCLLLVTLSFSSSAYAYQVEPMIHTIEPSGAASVMRIKITNTDASAIALELTGLRVTTDANGHVSREDEYEDLMIFPMQTSIPAGRSQVVQVRYIGDQQIEHGRVYAVKIDQLPVSVGGGSGDVSSQVKIGLSFLSHILVQGPEASASLATSEIESLDTGEMAFSIENTGTGTALLKELEWVLVDADNQQSILDIQDLDLGSFGAQIAGAPKRVLKIKPEGLVNVGTITKIFAKAE